MFPRRRMVRVFSTMAEYVHFLATLPIIRGEAFCLSFMPSAFFPKDAINRYFLAIDPIAEYQFVTSALWSYGKQMMHYLCKQQAELAVEVLALQRLCEGGSEHIN